MADSTTIQFTGDTADLQRKMDKVDKTHLRMLKRLRELGKVGKAAGNVMKRSYRGQEQHLDRLNRVMSKQERIIKNSGKATDTQTQRLKRWRMEAAALGRQLNRTGRSSKDLGRTSSRMTQGITRGLSGMIAQWVSVAGAIRIATMAMNKHYEQQDRRSSATRSDEDRLKELLTLGNNAKNPNAIRQKAFDIGIDKGVMPGEVYDLWYGVQSNAAGVKPGRIPGMVKSAAGIKQALPRVEAPDIATIYGKIASIDPSKTDKELSNLTMFAIERAGVGKAADVGGAIPKALAGGMVGNTSVRDALALFTTLTRVTASPDVAGTAVEMLNRRLMLSDPDALETARKMAAGVAVDPRKRKGIKGRKKYFAEAGFVEADTATQRVDKMARRNAEVPYTMDALNTIFGGRTAKYAKIVFAKHAEIVEERRLFATETARGKDIAGLKQSQILDDPMQALRHMQIISDVRKRVNQQQMDPMVLKTKQAMLSEIQEGSSDSGFMNAVTTGWARFARATGTTTKETRAVDDLYEARQRQIGMESLLKQTQAEAAGGGEYQGQSMMDKALEMIDSVSRMTGGGSPLIHTEPVAGGAN